MNETGIDQVSEKISQDAHSASETSAPGFRSDVAGHDRSDIDKSDRSANQCSVAYSRVIIGNSGCTKKKPRIAVEVLEKLTVGGGNENTGDQPELKPATVPADLSAKTCHDNTDDELEVDGFACESAIEMANVDSGDVKEKKKRMHGEVYDRAEKHGVALEDMRRSDDGRVVRNDNFEKVVGARPPTPDSGWRHWRGRSLTDFSSA